MKNDSLIDIALKEHARLESNEDHQFPEEMEAKLDEEPTSRTESRISHFHLASSAAILVISFGILGLHLLSKNKSPQMVSGNIITLEYNDDSPRGAVIPAQKNSNVPPASKSPDLIRSAIK